MRAAITFFVIVVVVFVAGAGISTAAGGPRSLAAGLWVVLLLALVLGAAGAYFMGRRRL